MKTTNILNQDSITFMVFKTMLLVWLSPIKVYKIDHYILHAVL